VLAATGARMISSLVVEKPGRICCKIASRFKIRSYHLSNWSLPALLAQRATCKAPLLQRTGAAGEQGTGIGVPVQLQIGNARVLVGHHGRQDLPRRGLVVFLDNDAVINRIAHVELADVYVVAEETFEAGEGHRTE
jgi:hypothetical protein